VLPTLFGRSLSPLIICTLPIFSLLINVLVTYRPEECPAIKLFAKQKGVEFIMMDKVDVNGLDASPVYHYLKKVAGPVRDLFSNDTSTLFGNIDLETNST